MVHIIIIIIMALTYSPFVSSSLLFQFSNPIHDRLCSLVVRVPGHRTEMYCAFCEVQTEFIYVM
jgi:hypothetical protein